MKLFLIIIVLAFIVFAVSIYLGWIFTVLLKKLMNGKCRDFIMMMKKTIGFNQY